jgi:hypothetical protein
MTRTESCGEFSSWSVFDGFLYPSTNLGPKRKMGTAVRITTSPLKEQEMEEFV